jgi:transmembrane sensor
VNQLQPSEKLRNAAVTWLVRLNSRECPEYEHAAFERWLNISEANRRVYNEVEAQWLSMEAFRSRRFRARDEALRYRPPRRAAGRVAELALAASVLAALGLTALSPEGWYGVGTLYQTAKGGHEIVTLADGSTLELNTNSLAKVRINGWRRSVELLRGEAYFKVVHEERRPFLVKAGNGEVRDLGTAFNVYARPDRVEVTVDDGSVQVEAHGSRVLVAGQRLAYGRRGEFLWVEKEKDDDLQATAWREGQIVFRDRPLEEVLREISRYHDTSVRLADTGLGSLHVSGIFRADDLDGTVNTIAMTLNLHVNRLAQNSIVLENDTKR